MQLEQPRWFNNEFMRRYRVYVVHPPPAERLKRLFKLPLSKFKHPPTLVKHLQNFDSATSVADVHHQKVRGAE